MNVGSLFSGIGGFDLGLERAGMRVVWQCESDPYRRRVLRRHWPGVPCFEDVRSVGICGEDGVQSRWLAGEQPSVASRASAPPDNGAGEHGSERVDLLCGGFPCQDLSVAGRRAGLAGERSGLFYEFMRVAGELVRPGGYVLIENVPGLFSSNGGRDFAIVLASLADLGFHDLAYRVLDSRYFGVPQRRRRVYVLGRRAGGRVCSEVLLEPESGGGDFTKGREARKGVAASLSRGSASAGVSAPGRRQEDDENLVNALDRRRGGADDNEAQAGQLVANTLSTRYGAQSGQDLGSGDSLIAHTLRSEGFDAGEDGTGRGTPLVAGTVRSHARPGSNEVGSIVGSSSNADRMRTPPGISGRVDDPHDPKPDGPRYAACGDAVTVNVSEWIGRRLLDFEREQVAA